MRAARSAGLSSPGMSAADGSTNAPATTGTSSMTSPGWALITSATITVTLSGPPPRSASSTSRSAHSCASGMRSVSKIVSVDTTSDRPSVHSR